MKQSPSIDRETVLRVDFPVMPHNLAKILKEEKIQNLTLKGPLMVVSSTPLEKVISQMEENRTGCVLIQDQGRLAGIFTERDFTRRVIEQQVSYKTPIKELMTPDPKCLQPQNSVSEAIQLMNNGGYRHIPIINKEGKPQGILSVKGVIKYLAEHFPCEVYNLPPDLHQVQRAPEGA